MKPQRANTLAMLALLALTTFTSSTAAHADEKVDIANPTPLRLGVPIGYTKNCRLDGIEFTCVKQKSSGQEARTFASLGNDKAAAHDFIGAIGDYTEAIKINPTFARPNAPDEDYFFRNSNVTKLLADYNQLVRDEPNNPYALALRGELKFMKCDNAGAKADFDRAIANKPDFFFALVRRADLINRTDNGSLADCNAALKYYPNCARLHHDKGIAYQFRQEHILAIKEFNRASCLNPQWSRPYYMLAQVHQSIGNSSKALTCFEECLRYEKTWTEPYLQQAAIWLEIHNYQRAISNYDQAIALTHSADHWLYCRRAEAKLASGDTLGAAADLTYYLMHDPIQVMAFTIELLLLFNIQIMALAIGRNDLKRKLLMYE